jgi:hypothetical protein
MPERVPLDQGNESRAPNNQERGRRTERLLAEEDRFNVEWSELQEQLTRTHRQLVELLGTSPTEDLMDRAAELQEKLEGIHDRQHEIVGRQASEEQAAIRLWYASDQIGLGGSADAIAQKSK